jgi:hypothetical protein
MVLRRLLFRSGYFEPLPWPSTTALEDSPIYDAKYSMDHLCGSLNLTADCI